VSQITSLDARAPSQAAAQLIAAFAYPEGGAHARRYAAALEHLAGRARDELDGAPPSPLASLLDEARIESLLSHAGKRHDRHMLAARMARPFLRKLETGIVRLPKSVPRLSLSAVASYIAEEAETSTIGVADPPSTLKRIWQPSRRVLPLAVALDRTAFGFEAHDRQLHIMALLGDPGLLEHVVALAAQLEPLLERLPCDKGKPVELLRFRYIH
jgi:hypothetical protein